MEKDPTNAKISRKFFFRYTNRTNDSFFSKIVLDKSESLKKKMKMAKNKKIRYVGKFDFGKIMSSLR